MMPKNFIPNKKSSIEDLLPKKCNGKVIELNNIDRIRFFKENHDCIIDWIDDRWKLYEKEGVRWYPLDMNEQALAQIKKELSKAAETLNTVLDESDLEHTNVKSLVESITRRIGCVTKPVKNYPDVMEIREMYRTNDGTTIILKTLTENYNVNTVDPEEFVKG